MKKLYLLRNINISSPEKIKKVFRLLIAAALFCTLPVSAADILVTNHSFESGLTGWTQMYPSPAGGNGSITAVTEQAADGSQSLKVVDNDATKNFGMESTKMPCTPGTIYIAYARVRLVSGTADLYLRFWNGSTLLSGPAVSTVSGPFNQWQNIAAKLTAPAGATHVSVMMYSNTSNIGTAYWDKTLITTVYTNLGMQVYDAGPNGTTFGIGVNAHKAYSVVVGADSYLPKMMVINTNTEVAEQVISFPAGPTGVWGAATATTGDVYFGSYSNATLYRHIPGGATISAIAQGPLAGESQIFDLAAGAGGKVFGGTYANSLFFSYTAGGAVTQISTKPIIASMEYIRSLAHDVTNGVTYMSVGVETGVLGTGIYRYHHGLNEKVSILSTSSLSGAIDYTGGRVFVNISGVMRVLNVVANANGSYQSQTQEATFVTPGHVSPAFNGKVYSIGSAGTLQSYDIASKVLTDLGFSASGSRVQRFGWVNNVLVGIGSKDNQTFILKYNPLTNVFSNNQVAGAAKIPGVLNEVQAGPDGKIYSSAYLTGGLGVYSPIRGDSNESLEDLMYSPITQIDRMATFNGKLYIGAYPGAFLHEYDPTQVWNPGTNPRQLLSLGANGQDRPKAITGAITANGNYVFMGTVAKTGQFDGGVSWYNLGTGASGIQIIGSQSVISMAVYGTQLFIGTSTRPGYSTAAVTTSSKVVVYNITATGLTYLQTLALPVANLKSITKMLVVGTKIWGFADGHIFVLNPTTKTFDSCNLKFPAINYGTLGTYRDADMFLVAKDASNVYGTIDGSLVKILISTISVGNISSGADKATADSFGNLYYQNVANKTTLWRYAFTATSGTYTSALSVTPAPVITSFSGCSNSTITLTGINFAGATAVSFNGTPADSFTVDSPTSISVKVGTGTSGEISVTTPGGIAAISGFKFIPTPSISADGSTTFFSGGKVVLTASTGSGYSYKWAKDGSEITGATKSTYIATISGFYTARVISDSCMATSTPISIHVMPNLSENNPKEKLISQSPGAIAYPNPFENILTLNLGENEKARIEISDLNGKVVYIKQYADKKDKISLDLTNLNSGMYLLKLSLDASVTVYKILKK